jgi:energy-coupling factor transport system ATP-binding protein
MNESAIEMKNVSFRYRGHEETALINLNLVIEKGSFVLITGKSGSGKTTLSRCINGIVPRFCEGELEGKILLNGIDTGDYELCDFGRVVGSVFQDPGSQFFMTDVMNEIAFGCLNMRMQRDEILKRTEESAKVLGIEELMSKRIFDLSSGEMQKVSIASCYAMGPDVYLLDEPSANLDQRSIKELRRVLGMLKSKGKTIIVLEHRLFYLTDLLDRMIILENGEIVRDMNQTEALTLKSEERNRLGLRVFNPEDVLPVAKREEQYKEGEETFRISELSFGYKRKKEDGNPKENVLQNISMSANKGEIIALIGDNGAGKTTLAKVCCGLLKGKSGSVVLNGRSLRPGKRPGNIYFVMQDSDYQLFGDSVFNEGMIGKRKNNDLNAKVEKTLKELSLWEEREKHPAALSRGQKQRLTIAGALMTDSRVVFFDEPTSGLDRDSMIRVSKQLKMLSEQGRIVFVITHDFEFVTETCQRVVCIDEGRVKDDFYISPSTGHKLLMLMGIDL